MKTLGILAFSSTLLVSPLAKADPLNTLADHAFIMDAETGQTLFSHHGETPMIPASMTKIMTVYMVLDRISDGRLKLDDTFRVSENAWRKGGAASGGSTMFLEPGSDVSVQDLLRGIIIQSGNDACIVVAENISGSEEAFAASMTERAQELGLESASFRNATGLYHEEHRISAADLAQLAYLTIQNHPDFYALYAEEEFTWNGIQQPNRNPLLGEVAGADGLKTGHLEISGYGLVGSAVRDGQRRIVVLNGLQSQAERADEARRVMRAAFSDFRIIEIVNQGDVVGKAEVWLGKEAKVELVASKSLSVPVHLDALRKVKTYIEYDGPVSAPIKAGDRIGRLIVSGLDGEDLSIPLAAGNLVERKGIFERAWVGLGMGG